MSGSKRLVVKLSETLERHLEKKSEEKGKNSQYIKDAIILYIEERKRMNI